MVNRNSSGFDLSALYFFLQTATCFTCFSLSEITVFNTVQT